MYNFIIQEMKIIAISLLLPEICTSTDDTPRAPTSAMLEQARLVRMDDTVNAI